MTEVTVSDARQSFDWAKYLLISDSPERVSVLVLM
jgi:hypothetical protein